MSSAHMCSSYGRLIPSSWSWHRTLEPLPLPFVLFLPGEDFAHHDDKRPIRLLRRPVSAPSIG